MYVLNSVSSRILLHLQRVVLEAITILCAINAMVSLFGNVHDFKVVLILFPCFVVNEVVILFFADANLQLAHVATCKEVVTAKDEVFGTEGYRAVGVVAPHNQVERFKACTTFECLIRNYDKHILIHLARVHVLELYGLDEVLVVESFLANGYGCIVVGGADVVVKGNSLSIWCILHIHVIDGMLVLGHQPLTAMQSPRRFTTCFVGHSVCQIIQPIRSGSRTDSDTYCGQTSRGCSFHKYTHGF